MPTDAAGRKGKATQEKFCHLVKLVSEFIYRTEGKNQIFTHLAVCEALSVGASTKRRKTIKRSFQQHVRGKAKFVVGESEG